MSKLSIVTAVSGRNEITQRWVNETLNNCDNPHEVVIMFNGSTLEEIDEVKDWIWHLRQWDSAFPQLKDPLGSSAAFNVAVKWATGDIIAMVHNDLMIKEKGWDTKLVNFFDTTPDVGIVGFAGAKQLGALDIYKRPYELTQLGRAHVFTSLEEWQPHGGHCVEPTQVAVLDGLSLCCRKDVFNKIGGFDEKMIHHMYDNSLSLEAHFAGYKNYVIPVLCDHLSGQTANYDRYGGWLQEKYGKTDGDIHRDSHEYFYKKYTNRLPVIVP